MTSQEDIEKYATQLAEDYGMNPDAATKLAEDYYAKEEAFNEEMARQIDVLKRKIADQERLLNAEKIGK